MTDERVGMKLKRYENAHTEWVKAYSRKYADMPTLLLAYDKMMFTKREWLRAEAIYLAEQHDQACHRDGTACLDGCDKAAL